tara:strand:+ start:178 stop:1239 length:1062 start_codon:yes stop_codon:yes gene_type:complete
MLITNILSFLFIITILVVIHELGHFLAAKSIGLRVEKFYVGFNLFGLGIKKKINDTEFGIGLFPIGGYVKVAGMVDESLDDQYQGKDDEYISKGMLQKVWFTSGGVIFNFILAFLLFSSIIYIDGFTVIKDEPILGNVIENRPAALLGLQNGDVITKLDNFEVSTWSDLSEYVHSNPSTKIAISWDRNGTILSDSILVGSMITPYGDSLGVIGIEPLYDKKSATFLTSINKGFSQTISWLVLMSYSIFSFFTGQLGVENFGGPIQIASIAGEASQMGIIALINLMAILSVNLGIINILPFPGLDGGHALIAIIEGIIGRRIPFKTLMIIQQIGVILLIIFFIIIMKNDITRLL